ncbi:uncharacterized protein LOC113280720 [Papaver somniferum]|uniref:uncharacterized protein LOC113280720 n=1 Tax=Papaver somniferum TaxID=3469 RepID=UPI000E6F8293|nr:uncharacterized protein LOC113280720 [Papaver somniferum]
MTTATSYLILLQGIPFFTCALNAVKLMLKSLPAAKRLLAVSNKKGNTVLHEVARTGIVKMATLIIEKELDGGGDRLLVSVPNLNVETPIYWEAMYGHKDMFLFLNTTASSRGITSTSTSTSMVSPLTIRTSDHSTILHAAVLVESYDVAMEILEIYPHLASSINDDGATASHILALSPSSFKSGTKYFQHYLGAIPFVLIQIAAAIVYSCLPVLKIIYNTKLKHNHAIRLLWKLLEKDYGQWTMSFGPEILHGWDYKYNNLENPHPFSTLPTRVTTYKVRERPIILATKLGIVEIFKEIINVYPESIEMTDEEAGRNLLHLAAEYIHASIIEFLKSSSTISKRNLDMLVVGIDRDGNTPLHAAANLGKHKPWHIRGAAQWTQWECVWFERVKRMLPPNIIKMKNSKNQYAYQVFTETHSDLREQGERWSKEASNNYMLLSALLATMMFGSISYGLFFCIISLGLFLTIQAAPFNEHDFFLRLPLRTAFSVTALFNTFTFTALSFFQAYMLITGWTGPLVWLNFDMAIGLVGLLFSADLYVDIVGCFIRYLIDILFI